MNSDSIDSRSMDIVEYEEGAPFLERATSRETPGVLGPRPLSETFAEIWTKLTDQQPDQGLAMTVYELRQLQPPRPAPGSYRLATEADLELLTGWSYDFDLEVHGSEPMGRNEDATSRRIANGDYRICEDGNQPVSYCVQSRPTPNGIYQRLGVKPLGEYVELDFV